MLFIYIRKLNKIHAFFLMYQNIGNYCSNIVSTVGPVIWVLENVLAKYLDYIRI